MKPEVESARRDWEDAYWRLLQEMRDPGRADDLHRQVVVVSEELKKRLGSNYTLVELAGEYMRADNWVRHAVAERAASSGWPATLSLVEGAAFLLHSRGAVDYKP